MNYFHMIERIHVLKKCSLKSDQGRAGAGEGGQGGGRGPRGSPHRAEGAWGQEVFSCLALLINTLKHCVLGQAEGAGVDQARAGAAAWGGEASQERRGAGEDDPGQDAHRGVGKVKLFFMLDLDFTALMLEQALILETVKLYC